MSSYSSNGEFEGRLRSRGTYELLLLSLGALACSQTLPEMPSVQELAASTKPTARCDHLVEVVDRDRVNRPYTEISRVSVTCHPTLPKLCERRLRDRACVLGADAILIDPAATGASRNAPNSRDQLRKHAILARW